MKVRHYLVSSDKTVKKLHDGPEFFGKNYRVRTIKNMSPDKNHVWYSIFEDDIALENGERLVLKSGPFEVSDYDRFKFSCENFKEFYPLACIVDYELKDSYKAIGSWAFVGEVDSESEEERQIRVETLDDLFSCFPTQEEIGFKYEYVDLVDANNKVLKSISLKGAVSQEDVSAFIQLLKLIILKGGKKDTSSKNTNAKQLDDMHEQTEEAVKDICSLANINGNCKRSYELLGSLLCLSKTFGSGSPAGGKSFQ